MIQVAARLPEAPKVAFVENKSFPVEDVMAVLAPATTANHHTNFGPVSLQLERALSTLNWLGPDRAACATSNGTAALHAAIAAFENHFGRKLRWLVSDFGFMTSFIGPLANQSWVTCRQDGLISVAALERRDPASFDAVLATNVFGLHEDFDDVFEFCRRHGKALLIDNAPGFRALARYHRAAGAQDDLLWAEIISLHHTKPWGMGEGGAVFLPESLFQTCRSAINFGVGQNRFLPILDLCGNGKMCEIAAAQILLRVQGHDFWTEDYHAQARRIMEIGRAAGLTPLVSRLPTMAVPGQIPFLSQRPVKLEELQGLDIPILKYYRPGPASGPVARWIYAHVLNVPSHPEMAAIPDHVLERVLAGLA